MKIHDTFERSGNFKDLVDVYSSHRIMKLLEQINELYGYFPDDIKPLFSDKISSIINTTINIKDTISGDIANILDNQLGLSIKTYTLETDNKILNRKISFDMLTGLYSRSAIFERINIEINNFKRNNRTFSIIMSDLDHFKEINDKYGHIIGDEILKFTGITFKEVLRLSDATGRFGGEEFITILPDTKAQEAIIVANRIRSVFELSGKDENEKLFLLHTIKINRSDKEAKYILSIVENIEKLFNTENKDFKKALAKLTISMGITQITEDDIIKYSEKAGNQLVEEIINRADKLLYKSKSNGRNMINY